MSGVFDSDFFDPAVDLSTATAEPAPEAARVAAPLRWCPSGLMKAAAAFTVAAVVHIGPSIGTVPVVDPMAIHAAFADASPDEPYPDRVYQRPQDIDRLASFLLSKSKKLERLDHLI
jgi:hypothetical protein